MSAPNALLGVLGANLLGFVFASKEGTSSVLFAGIDINDGLLSGELDIDCGSVVCGM